MITHDKVSPEFKTDHLLLLVGANPLPNYVAAYLLARPDTIIHILHSAETKDIAKALDVAMARRSSELEPYFWQIDKTDSAEIAHEVKKILTVIGPRQSVGLHYTGGTKAMSVHTYRTIADHRNDAVFTYLDAQTLSLVVDGGKGKQTTRISVQFLCNVTLPELLQFRWYELPKDKQTGKPTKLRTEPEQVDLIKLLANVAQDVPSYKEWRNWYDSAFGINGNIDDAVANIQNPEMYPSLTPIAELWKLQTKGNLTPDTLANQLGFKRLESAAKWLNGLWLEEYGLLHLCNIVESLEITSYGVGIEATKSMRQVKKKGMRKLELDLAAMYGYQLYAISCIASDRKSKCKEHLLEVFVRARQLGGDEARSALVCCLDDPMGLEIEVREAWFAGSRNGLIKVFGREHLADLETHMHDWFKTPNE